MTRYIRPSIGIYTTIAALYAKFVLKIGPISTRTVSIRRQSSRKFVYAYILPVRDLWTARFLRLSFVLYDKKSKNVVSPQLRFLDAIFMRQFSGVCRHRRLLKLRTTSHDYAQLSTMVDFIILSIQLVFMVLGVSFHGFLLSDPRVAAQLVTRMLKQAASECEGDTLIISQPVNHNSCANLHG